MRRRCIPPPTRAAWCRGGSGEAQRLEMLPLPPTCKTPGESHSLSQISVSRPLRTTDTEAKWSGRRAAQGAQPQRPRWLAACPRITHPLWSHFPPLHNRHSDALTLRAAWRTKPGKAHRGTGCGAQNKLSRNELLVLLWLILLLLFSSKQPQKY